MDTLPPDNSMPIAVGLVYRIGKSTVADDYIIITALDSKYVYAQGIGDLHADLQIPIWKFDDETVLDGSNASLLLQENQGLLLQENGGVLLY